MIEKALKQSEVSNLTFNRRYKFKPEQPPDKPLQKICWCGRFMAIKWEFEWYHSCKCGIRYYKG